MFRLQTAITLAAFIFVTPALAQPPRPPGGTADRGDSSMSVDRWLQQLDSELDHLQEDLYYERGKYPEGLRDKVDRTSHAVARFQHVMRDPRDRDPRDRDSKDRDSKDRNSRDRDSRDQDHVRRDFQEMDKQVHELVKILQQSGDSWLRRQATRINYADEQVHYTLQRRWEQPKSDRRELIARQAHLLEEEARDLEALAERVIRRDQNLRDQIHEFADQADRFHQVVEKRVDERRMREEFDQLDETWHRVVDRVNSSSSTYYLRAAAGDVNRIHNQVHDLVNGHEHGHDHEHARQDAPAPKPVPTPTPAPPAPPRKRPAIEFEIPGIGRFQIPR